MTKSAVKAVGVVGAGRMGTPIIGHLVRKGFATRACDLDAARASAVKKLGAQWVASPESLAAESDAILVCVGFDREAGDDRRDPEHDSPQDRAGSCEGV